jgi:hypothetical protein
MAEYSRIAKGSFTATSTQTSAVIPLPFVPDFVEVWNLTNISNAASAGNILRAYWDNNLPPVTPSGKSASSTMVEVYNSTPAVIYDTIYTNGVTGGTAPAGGITTFQAGQLLQYGATQQIIGITKANPARVNVTGHGYSVGDTVIMQGLATGTTNNMQLLNGVPFTIVAVSDANHFDVQWNTNQSNYTALSASPSGALVKKVLYPFLYLPQDNVISNVTTGGSQTVITTTMYHNLEVGQEVAFRVTPFWGMIQLNSLPNTLIPGSPNYSFVTSISGTVNAVVLDNWNFAVSLNSSAFTAFTTNQTMTSSTLPGTTYAQVVAVGDVNTGGRSISLGSPLYPPPMFPLPNNPVGTINGPAIKGAFVNNTMQGFIIGNGTPQEQAGTGTIVTASSEIYWRAYLSDFANP